VEKLRCGASGRRRPAAPRQSPPTARSLRAARASRGATWFDGAGEHSLGGDRAPEGNVAPGRQPTSRSGRGRASARAEHRRTARGASSEYNRDGSRRRISYPNALVATPSVAFEYDQDYPRVVQMTDGIGTSQYSYNPAGPVPRLGANRLARVDGPLPNAVVTYDYDELGTVKSVGVNGDARTIERDLAGRITSETNALGEFTYTYDGASNRLETETYPNGQTVEYGYGTVQQDFDLRRITNEVNGNLLSEFTYERDVAAGRITTWTQAASGEPTKTYTFGYDATNQLTSATLAVSGQPDEVTTYSYDAAGNRLTELIDGVGSSYSYNGVNELTAISGATPPEATYQWDAQDRLIGVTSGATAVSLRYDGLSRLSSVLVAANGSPGVDSRARGRRRGYTGTVRVLAIRSSDKSER
jgi:YD repeat-containing protein